MTRPFKSKQGLIKAFNDSTMIESHLDPEKSWVSIVLLDYVVGGSKNRDIVLHELGVPVNLLNATPGQRRAIVKWVKPVWDGETWLYSEYLESEVALLFQREHGKGDDVELLRR